jgi:hypothetical protein
MRRTAPLGATLTALLLAAALTLTPAVASAARARPPAVRLLTGSLVTPREHPAVLARVRASTRTLARLRLLGGDRRTLARVAALHLRADQTRTVRLPLGAEAVRRLGSCRVARLTLLARVGGRTLRSRARTRLDPLRCGPLRWPPPQLANPQTIQLGQGFSMLHLDPARDYVLQLPPARKLGGTFVEGGHDVIVIGGWITVPTGTTSDEQRRALYFKDQTGIVHVEGVLIDGSGGGDADGIALHAPQATVQIENVRVAGLHGSQATTHADVVQPWGGVGQLRIDRLTGTSGFQGLQLPIALGPIGAAEIRYADLHALPEPLGHGGGHMLWLTTPHMCNGYPVALNQVWISPRPGRTLANSVWPGVADGSACPGVREGGGIGWPKLPVRGTVLAGSPPGGDFVPQWNVGLGYRSPGYTASPAALPSVDDVFRTSLQAPAPLGALARAPAASPPPA